MQRGPIRWPVVLAVASLCLGSSAAPAAAQKTPLRPWFSRTAGVKAEPAQRGARSSGRGSPAAAERPSSGRQIVRQALRYRGAHYHFGGNSKSKGFDCSGLVERIYNDLQFKRVPHASGALYRMGKPVHLSELRPGDLVFFKNTYRRGISHVGVYAGHNRFVHARNRHFGVTVTSLADPYFQLHYAGARRLY